MKFRCAVLDDETRVINGTEFMRVMGIYRSGALSTRRSEEDEVYFPLHLAFKNLRPFILDDVELVAALRVPIRYRSVRGSIAEAIPATVLRRICSVWVRARNEGVLGSSQEKVADKAESLLNALADVAIIALIDEATGYQKRRAHNELQAILKAYIAPELLPWQSRFPLSFYEQIYRVMGWPYDASSTKRTAYIGKRRAEAVAPISRSGDTLVNLRPAEHRRHWELIAERFIGSRKPTNSHRHPIHAGEDHFERGDNVRAHLFSVRMGQVEVRHLIAGGDQTAILSWLKAND